MRITGSGPVAATTAAVATPAAGVAPAAAVVPPGTAVLGAKVGTAHVLVLLRIAEISRGGHAARVVAIDDMANQFLACRDAGADGQAAGEVTHDPRAARWRIARTIAVTGLHARIARRQQPRAVAL